MMAVPLRTCWTCGEFLPHACAPLIVLSREPDTGKLVIVSITDREPA